MQGALRQRKDIAIYVRILKLRVSLIRKAT